MASLTFRQHARAARRAALVAVDRDRGVAALVRVDADNDHR